MGHRQCRLADEAAFGLVGSIQNGCEGAFDRVRRPDVCPVFGREVLEGEQICAVLGQAFDGSVIIHAIGIYEEIERGLSGGLGLSHLLPGGACLHAREARCLSDAPWLSAGW